MTSKGKFVLIIVIMILLFNITLLLPDDETIDFSLQQLKICSEMQEFADGQTLYALGYPMDINKVTAHDLEILSGIGSKLAKNIINYRELHGRFKSVNDLLKVKGIGEKKLEKIKTFLINF